MASEITMFEYLDGLRDAGVSSSSEARSKLMDTFNLPPVRASQIFSRWMTTFRARADFKEAA